MAMIYLTFTYSVQTCRGSASGADERLEQPAAGAGACKRSIQGCRAAAKKRKSEKQNKIEGMVVYVQGMIIRGVQGGRGGVFWGLGQRAGRGFPPGRLNS